MSNRATPIPAITFERACEMAANAACNSASPFVPSPQQREDAIAPLVADMGNMPARALRQWVLDTYQPTGYMARVISAYRKAHPKHHLNEN